jgi:hypothetical protein
VSNNTDNHLQIGAVSHSGRKYSLAAALYRSCRLSAFQDGLLVCNNFYSPSASMVTEGPDDVNTNMERRSSNDDVDVVGGASRSSPSSSRYLQARISSDLSRTPSRESRGHLPYPASGAPNSSASLQSRVATPAGRDRSLSRLSKRSSNPSFRRKIRIEAEGDRTDSQSSPQQHDVSGAASTEPGPLWYKSQLFPHRYGSSMRRDPLLSPPARSSTFPARLPSRNVKSADRRFLGPLRGTSTASSVRANEVKLDGNRAGHGKGVTVGKRATDTGPTQRPSSVHEAGVLDSSSTPQTLESHSDTGAGAAEPSLTDGPSVAPERPVERSMTLPVHLINPARPDPQANENRNAWIRRRRTGDVSDETAQRNHRRPTLPVVVPRVARDKGYARPAPRSPSANGRFDDYFLHYDWLVDRLATHMPQLINVRGRDCRELSSGRMVCYDSLLSGGLPRLLDQIIYQTERWDSPLLLERIRNFKVDRARNVRYRYILVEDLSPRIIDHLGTTFWLNPEFFEEHLNRSGYRPESYNDPMPSTWNTSATPKDFVSVRWFRPVRRARIKPLSEIERDTLLMRDHSSGTLTWPSSSPEGERYTNSVRLRTNIFRKEWPIVSDPDQAIWENDPSDFPVAWEEKVTIQVSETVGHPPVCEYFRRPQG